MKNNMIPGDSIMTFPAEELIEVLEDMQYTYFTSDQFCTLISHDRDRQMTNIRGLMDFAKELKKLQNKEERPSELLKEAY